jgi:secreted trypsin-like serine protease
VFVRNGPRVFTRFAYFQDWLDNKDERNVTGAEVLALKLASLAGL